MLPFFAQQYAISLDGILEIQYTEEFKHTSELFHCDNNSAQRFKKEYHESDLFSKLTAYDDALKFINENKDKYEFIAITALEPTEKTYKNRLLNINTLFPGAFSKIVLTGNDKYQAMLGVVYECLNQEKEIIAYCDDLLEHCESFERAQNELLDGRQLAEVIHFNRGKRQQSENNEFHVVGDWDNLKEIL